MFLWLTKNKAVIAAVLVRLALHRTALTVYKHRTGEGGNRASPQYIITVPSVTAPLGFAQNP